MRQIQRPAQPSLLKARPRVSLSLGGDLRAGGELNVGVILDVSKPISVNQVSATLTGWMSRLAPTLERRLMQFRHMLQGEGTLSVGRHTYREAFPLPESIPATFLSDDICIHYILQVHVDIPWWLDRRSTIAVPIEHPAERIVQSPVVAVSSNDRSRGGVPYGELSLASSHVVPGGTLEGSIALYNSSLLSSQTFWLILERCHRVTNANGSYSSEEQLIFARHIIPAGLTDGEAFPIELRLPSDVTPTYQSPDMDGTVLDIAWTLICSLEASGTQDLELRVPVRISVAKGARVPRKPTVPSVGSKRVQKLWKQQARLSEMRFDGNALRYANDAGEIVISSQGEDGPTHLLAEIRWAQSLELGLDVAPSSNLSDHLAGQWVGHRRFDHNHAMRSRDLRQLDHVLGPLMTDWPKDHRLDADDERWRIYAPGAGHNEDTLSALVQTARNVLARVPVLMQQVPLPQVVVEHRQWWHEMSGLIDAGRFQAASASISGRRHGRAVSLAVNWTDDARADGLVMGALARISSSYSCAVSTPEGSLPPELSSQAQRQIGLLMERRGLEVRRLVIGVDGVRVHVKWPCGTPREALEHLDALVVLTSLLEGGMGPYR